MARKPSSREQEVDQALMIGAKAAFYKDQQTHAIGKPLDWSDTSGNTKLYWMGICIAVLGAYTDDPIPPQIKERLS